MKTKKKLKPGLNGYVSISSPVGNYYYYHNGSLLLRPRAEPQLAGRRWGGGTHRAAESVGSGRNEAIGRRADGQQSSDGDVATWRGGTERRQEVGEIPRRLRGRRRRRPRAHTDAGDVGRDRQCRVPAVVHLHRYDTIRYEIVILMHAAVILVLDDYMQLLK